MKSFPTYALHNPIAIHQGDRENRNVVKSQVLTLPCSSSSSDSISDYYIPLHYYSYSSTTDRFWISFLDQNFSWFKIRTWVTFSPVYWSWHDTDTYSIFTTGRLQITGVKFTLKIIIDVRKISHPCNQCQNEWPAASFELA